MHGSRALGRLRVGSGRRETRNVHFRIMTESILSKTLRDELLDSGQGLQGRHENLPIWNCRYRFRNRFNPNQGRRRCSNIVFLRNTKAWWCENPPRKASLFLSWLI